jgi:hypothetical protein
MLTHLVIGATALVVSGVTLFLGFGLGTILMPAFALFFPLTVAIAATAVVHPVNNLFKLVLVGRQADWPFLARFALPAEMAAIAGAWLLGALAQMSAPASRRACCSTQPRAADWFGGISDEPGLHNAAFGNGLGPQRHDPRW